MFFLRVSAALSAPVPPPIDLAAERTKRLADGRFDPSKSLDSAKRRREFWKRAKARDERKRDNERVRIEYGLKPRGDQ